MQSRLNTKLVGKVVFVCARQTLSCGITINSTLLFIFEHSNADGSKQAYVVVVNVCVTVSVACDKPLCFRVAVETCNLKLAHEET